MGIETTSPEAWFAWLETTMRSNAVIRTALSHKYKGGKWIPSHILIDLITSKDGKVYRIFYSDNSLLTRPDLSIHVYHDAEWITEKNELRTSWRLGRALWLAQETRVVAREAGDRYEALPADCFPAYLHLLRLDAVLRSYEGPELSRAEINTIASRISGVIHRQSRVLEDFANFLSVKFAGEEGLYDEIE